jgi:ferredoxin
MAYKIIASQCTVCGACEFECPNAAIRLKNDMYIIDPKKCTECEGHFDTPQCAVVCPGGADGTIDVGLDRDVVGAGTARGRAASAGSDSSGAARNPGDRARRQSGTRPSL